MSKVLDDINKQESIEGLTEDLKLVKAWYDIVCKNSSSSNTFHALVKVEFRRYGTASFHCHRFYHPSAELKELLQLKEV